MSAVTIPVVRLVLVRVARVDREQTMALPESGRGAGGFGSTGRTQAGGRQGG